MISLIATVFAKFLPDVYFLDYITVRAAGAMLTSLLLSLLFGNFFITWSKRLFTTTARAFTPDTHRVKDNIPSMGGAFILVIVAMTVLLWSDLQKPDAWLILMSLFGFGFIGLLDDLSKVWYKQGISARLKMSLQIIIGLLVVGAWLWTKQPDMHVWVPCLKDLHPDLGWFFVLWALLVIVGASNAVNLTDGLDGLAIGTLITNFVVFGVISYVAGHALFADYLHIAYTHTAEVAIICSMLIGASLGFLWFNAHPAQVFMGDVGSLSLGATLGLMALMTKQELVLVISGGMFVLEAMSVMVQLFFLKNFKKRIFKMAPIHHHFEMLGWHEPKITMRFNIISVILALVALLTLKIR